MSKLGAIVTIFLLGLWASVLHGDTLETVDGRRFDGRLVRQNDKGVVFEVYRAGSSIRMSLKPSEVLSIARQEITAPRGATTQPAGQSPASKIQSPAAPVIPMAAKPTGVSGNRSDIVAHARNSIFQVLAKKSGEAMSSGTGCLLGSEGFAVTNHHVIDGASAAWAVFESHPKDMIPLELWAARAELDLAVLKISRASATRTPLSKGFLIASVEPRPGDEVWALGFPFGLGFTYTQGSMSAARQGRDLLNLAKGLDYDPNSHWIQTDCAINHGNSGGPLLNERGELIGVNTCGFLRGNQMYFAVSAKHVSQVLSEVPKQPLRFAELRPRPGQQRAARGRLPVVYIPEEVAAADVSVAAEAVHRSARCRVCKGTGIIVRRVTLRPREFGRGKYANQPPVVEDRKEQCGSCGGTGVDAAAFGNTATRFVVTLSSARRDDPALPQRLKFAAESIYRAAELNPSLFQQRLGGELTRATRHEETPLGTPFLGIGYVFDDIRIPGEGTRYQFVLIEDRLVLLSNVILYEVSNQRTVVFGGRFAGFLDLADGRVVMVLQNGFAVGSR